MQENLFESMLANLQITEKQKAVLRASMELFSEKGFEQTSTKDIAKAAGVAEGTVYKNYKTKQAILDAIIDPFVENNIPLMVQDLKNKVTGLAEKLTVREYFKAIAIDRFTMINNNTLLLRLLFRTILSRNEAKDVITNKILIFIFGDFEKVVKQYQDQGLIEKRSLADILHIILGSYGSYAMPVIYGLEDRIDVNHAANNLSYFLNKALKVKN